MGSELPSSQLSFFWERLLQGAGRSAASGNSSQWASYRGKVLSLLRTWKDVWRKGDVLNVIKCVWPLQCGQSKKYFAVECHRFTIKLGSLGGERGRGRTRAAFPSKELVVTLQDDWVLSPCQEFLFGRRNKPWRRRWYLHRATVGLQKQAGSPRRLELGQPEQRGAGAERQRGGLAQKEGQRPGLSW